MSSETKEQIVDTFDGVKRTYKQIRDLMSGEPFTMSLVEKGEIAAVIAAVNQGIDSHLEACHCPDRGDSYEREERKLPDGRVIQVAMSCTVSPESLPVLLRRLMEDSSEEHFEAATRLAGDILYVLENPGL